MVNETFLFYFGRLNYLEAINNTQLILFHLCVHISHFNIYPSIYLYIDKDTYVYILRAQRTISLQKSLYRLFFEIVPANLFPSIHQRSTGLYGDHVLT